MFEVNGELQLKKWGSLLAVKNYMKHGSKAFYLNTISKLEADHQILQMILKQSQPPLYRTMMAL